MNYLVNRVERENRVIGWECNVSLAVDCPATVGNPYIASVVC